MDSLKKIMHTFDKILNNTYFSGFVIIFLSLYSSLIVSKLPQNIIKLFENQYIKLFLILLIALISMKNINIALFSSVALVLTIMQVNTFIDLQENDIYPYLEDPTFNFPQQIPEITEEKNRGRIPLFDSKEKKEKEQTDIDETGFQ